MLCHVSLFAVMMQETYGLETLIVVFDDYTRHGLYLNVCDFVNINKMNLIPNTSN